MKRKCVADLEADGLLGTATKVWCGVFKDIETGEVFKFLPNEIDKLLSFMDTCSVLIMHNGIGYDWPLLRKLYRYEFKGEKVDTLIMSRLLNPKRLAPFNCPNKGVAPNSVEAWGWRVGRGKPEHDDWSQFSEDMLHRCSEDVEIQHLIYKELLKEAEGGDWEKAFLLSFKLFEILQKQEEYGWLVDQNHMHFCIHQLDHWIGRIDRALDKNLPLVVEVKEQKIKGEYQYIRKPFLKSGKYNASVDNWHISNGVDVQSVIVGGPFSRITFRKVDLNSSNEVKEYLLKEGWEPLEWNYNDEGEKMSPKLNKDDPFDGITSGIGRLVARRVQCRQRRGIIQGLFKKIRPDGRIASVVNTLAVTGRATHRNIVNIPKVGSFFGKQMRKIFICSDKKVLVGTDSDACQIRMLAGRMNDPDYTETVINGDKSKGTDIHSVNQRAAKLPDRDTAKTFFYGFLFGAGDAKIGKFVKGNSSTGKKLKEQFLNGLPALRDLMERIVTEWREKAKKKYNPIFNKFEFYDGYITGLDGRPVKVPSERQILVYLLQSDEAIMMQAAYNRFDIVMSRRGYRWYEDYGIVCWYHDEWTVECREEIKHEVAKLAEECISWAGRFFKIPCPHVGQAKTGKSWYEIH